MMENEENKTPWYQNGLRFRCTECGQCCTGGPGYVWVTQEEIAEIAQHLQITEDAFIRKYTRQVGSKLALLENKKNYDCVFLKDKRCSVYTVRPKQCRTFPWWKENLSSQEAWEQAASYCEGIDREDAPLISIGEIKKHL